MSITRMPSPTGRNAEKLFIFRGSQPAHAFDAAPEETTSTNPDEGQTPEDLAEWITTNLSAPDLEKLISLLTATSPNVPAKMAADHYHRAPPRPKYSRANENAERDFRERYNISHIKVL